MAVPKTDHDALKGEPQYSLALRLLEAQSDLRATSLAAPDVPNGLVRPILAGACPIRGMGRLLFALKLAARADVFPSDNDQRAAPFVGLM